MYIISYRKKEFNIYWKKIEKDKFSINNFINTHFDSQAQQKLTPHEITGKYYTCMNSTSLQTPIQKFHVRQSSSGQNDFCEIGTHGHSQEKTTEALQL